MVFAATEILPGDAARAVLGRDATPSALAAMQARLHLDRPLPAQYGIWLADLVIGASREVRWSTAGRCWSWCMPRVRNSLTLLALAGLVGVPLSVLAGILAASRRDGAFDSVTSVTALALAATPEFVVAFMTIILFATSVFRWLPPVSLVRARRATCSRGHASWCFRC